MNELKMLMKLTPTDGRKSFCGKACVMELNGAKVLYSYNTPVALFVNSHFYRLWSGYSATTMRHIAAFTDYLGCKRLNKAAWMKLPVKLPISFGII